jgi:hypothetical protein
MKRRHHTTHSSLLWDRLIQIVKVESAFDGPVEFQVIRKLCRDIALEDLDATLREMIICRRLLCSRHWEDDDQMIETYTYNG